MERADKQKLFDQILMENRKWLRIIARNSADGSNYEDLEQEILFALWKSLDRYEGRSNLKTWFYSIASNVVRDFTRRNSYQRRVSGMLVMEEPATYGNSHNLSESQILEDFLRSLDEMDRLIFLMCLDKVSYREMAVIVNGDEAHLRVRVNRLKKQYELRYIGR
jgi:RNA polymerase sigma factor (sigma-70 family)